MEIEVSLKVRSAIKAKLLELGVHVDEELPDYIMVLVANRRTKPQMDNDLELFLSENTSKFTTWLFHVLKKLEQVTLADPSSKPDNVKSDKSEKSTKINLKSIKASSSSSANTKVDLKSIKSTKIDLKSIKSSSKADASPEKSIKSSFSPEKTLKTSSSKSYKNEDTITSSSTQKIDKSEKSKKESKVQFKLKSSTIDSPTEFDKKSKTEGKSRKEEKNEKVVSSTTTDKKIEKVEVQPPDSTNNEEDEEKLRIDVLHTAQSKKAQKVSPRSVSALKGLVLNNETRNKRKLEIENDKDEITSRSEKISKVNKISKSDRSDRSSKKEITYNSGKREKSEKTPPRKLRSVVSALPLLDEKREEPKLSSVVCVTSTSNLQKSRPIRDSKMSTNLIFRAMREAECDSKIRSHRDRRRSRSRSRSRDYNRKSSYGKNDRVDRVKRKSAYFSSDDDSRPNKMRREKRYYDMPRSMERRKEPEREDRKNKEPTELFTSKNRKRQSVKERLGERRVESFLDSSVENDGTVEEDEENVNIIIKVQNPGFKEVDLELEEAEKEEKNDEEQIDTVELLSDDDEEENKSITRPFVPPRISICVVNSSEESDYSESESEAELEVTAEDDIGELESNLGLPPPTTKALENSEEINKEEEKPLKHVAPPMPIVESVPVVRSKSLKIVKSVPVPTSEELKKEQKQLELLSNIRAKLNTISRPITNSSLLPYSYTPQVPTNPFQYLLKKSQNSQIAQNSVNQNSTPPPTPPNPTPSNSQNVTSVNTTLTMCKFWPQCSFGAECKFIHPKCLYNELCTKRPFCNYQHDNEEKKGVAKPTKVVVEKKIFGEKKIFEKNETRKQCMYFPKCHTMNCTFYHPKPCRYGLQCTDNSCTHFHPGKNLPSLHQLKWKSGKL